MVREKNIRKILLTIIILISVVSNLLAFDGLESFTGKSESNSIILEWEINSQKEIESLTILKRRTGEQDFNSLHKFNSIASNSYKGSYKDESPLYKSLNMSFEYQLRIVMIDQSIEYSSPITVNMNISSVNQTWGSIKAMFR